MKKTFILGALLCLGNILTGCGGSSGGAATSDVAISGTLAGSRLFDTRDALTIAEIENYGRPDLSSYAVRCVTLSGTPIAGSGTCDAAGNFSLSMAGAAGLPLGCFVINATSGAVVASMAFAASDTDIDGSTSQTGTYTAGSGGTYSFGTITLDTVHGTATVNIASIVAPGGGTGTGTATGTWANVKGEWNLECVNPPAGDTIYSNCDTRTGGEGEHHGPPDKLFMDQIDGVSDGTKTHSFFAVWDSKTGYEACGSTEGKTLPSGWTSSDTSLTNPLTLDTISLAAIKADCRTPNSCTITATTTNSSTGLTNISFTGGCEFVVNAAITGTNIPASTKITAVSFAHPMTITMNNAATGNGTSTLTITPGPVTTCGTACVSDTTTCNDVTNAQGWRANIGVKGNVNSNTTLTVTEVHGQAPITAGMGVMGQGIPGGTTVVSSSISGGTGTITLSQAANETGTNRFFSVGSNVTYSDADCKAQCVAQNIHKKTASCRSRWNTNWAKSQTITAPGDLACSATSCGVNSGLGYVTRGNDPEDRFIGGELFITGNTASTVSNRNRDNDSVCLDQSDQGCKEIKCPNSENVRFNMIQSDANNLTADVSIERRLAPSANSRCSENSPGNHLANELTPRRYLIKAKRAVPVARDRVATAK